MTERLKDRFAERMEQDEIKNQLLSRDSLLGYLYARKDISSLETVKHWVRGVTETDQGLIDLLMHLRTNVFSTDRGAYRCLDQHQVSPFFDDWHVVEQKIPPPAFRRNTASTTG